MNGLFLSGPAAKNGCINLGDILLDVDGISCQNKTLTDMSSHIVGPYNSVVTMVFFRFDSGLSKKIYIQLFRKPVHDLLQSCDFKDSDSTASSSKTIKHHNWDSFGTGLIGSA